MPFGEVETQLPSDSVNGLPADFSVTPTEQKPAGERPAWSDVIGRTFEQENILAGGYRALTQGAYGPDDPNFNAFEAIKGTPYEASFGSFVDVRNETHLNAVKRRIDREQEDHKILDAAPWWMTLPAGLLANGTDPTNFLPVGGAFVRGAKGGFQLARSAGSVAVNAGAGAALQEGFLQRQQELRTWEESAAGIGSSVVLGGLIGAGGAAVLSRAETRSFTRSIDRDLARISPQSIRENPATAPVYEDMKSQLLSAPNKPAWLDEDYADKVATLTAARYQARAERLNQGIERSGEAPPPATPQRIPPSTEVVTTARDEGNGQTLFYGWKSDDGRLWRGTLLDDGTWEEHWLVETRDGDHLWKTHAAQNEDFPNFRSRDAGAEYAANDLPKGATPISEAAPKREPVTAYGLYRGEGVGVRQGVNPEGPAGIEMRGPTAPQIFDQPERVFTPSTQGEIIPRAIEDKYAGIDYISRIGKGEADVPSVDDLSRLMTSIRDAEREHLGLDEATYKRLQRLNREIDEGSDSAIAEKNAILSKVPKDLPELDVPDGAAIRQLRLEYQNLERQNFETPGQYADGIARVLKRYIADFVSGDDFARAVFRKAFEEARRHGIDTKKLGNDIISRFLGDLSSSDQEFMRSEFKKFTSPKLSPSMAGKPVEQVKDALPEEKGKEFFQFGGERAATANTDVLAKARQMADEGYWPQDIWEQTGWYRGADGKWRFEISDDKATLGKLPEFGVDRTLGEVLIHPQLYEAYPELANMRVYTVKGLGSAYTHPDAAGAGEAIRLQGAHPDLKYDVRSHLLHEVQHAIQRREAFAQGAEEAKAGPDVYHRTAGEVEARNVEQRRDMTPEERLANPPWRTEDVPAGQQLFQRGAEPKGRIILQTNKAIIDLFASADKSTFLHELGHLWLDELSRDAARANVPQALKDDLGSVLRWLGVDKIEDIKRPQHEQWATAFERYLNEGKAPSSALAQAFESFKQWLTTIYRSLTDVNATITDDIRGVMDRMLASDREIAAAQARVERSGFGASVGAAAVSVPSTGEAAIAGRMAGGLARVTSWISPGLRLAHSDSPVARDAGLNLFEFTSYLKQNDNGIASPTAVETLRKAWEGKFNEALQDHQKAYSDYRKRVGSGGLLQRASSIFRDDDTTSFNGQVGRAMRQEDTHAEPEIARAAASWRKNVIEPFTKAALEEKLFPAEIADRIAQGLPPSTAPSYFPRLWNRNRLVAEEGAFKREVVDWALESMPSWERASANAIEKRLAPLRSEIDDLEMAKLRRGEEARAREEEIQTGEYTEADIRNAIQMVRGGAQKPKGVKTLTQFVVESGGLWDPGGDVRGMGAGPRSRPGLLRAERRRAQNPNGGWALDDMARHAWESGYFPNKVERPSVNEFLDALSDDFNKRRAVLRDEDRDAFRMTEIVNQIEQDLSRLGVGTEGSPRFATSEETKGIIKRVYDAMNARDDRRLEDLRAKLKEREAESRVDHEARFSDPNGHAREIADDVFNKLTGKSIEGPLPEFVTVNARGPLKERTFNIPDARVERWLESDAELVLDRYQRTMSADIELARKFGTPDMKDALTSVQQDYLRLREGIADPKQLTKMDGQEKADIRDLTAVRDLIRGNYKLAEWERGFGQVARMATAVEYMMKMGQVVISSLTEPVRVVAARGLVPFVKDGMAVLGNLDAFKLSAAEAKLAGNISDRLRGGRVFSLADLGDYYGTRGVMDKFLANMTNIASTLNGIHIWTDGEKMFTSTMIQNKMLRTAVGYGKASAEDKRYLAFLGIDEGMASRIAKQFADHGEDSKGVFVAGTREWTDDIAVRQYRAALNKDLDSMVVTRGVADVPLFANTPLGRMLFQFRTFNISSHQRMLLRGLQEDQVRFLSGVVAMSSFGMLQMYVAAVATNSQSKFPNGAEGLAASMQKNPGWWIGEGLDHSGLLTIPFEISNAVEKLTGGVNPLKAPLKAFDEGNAISVKNRPRNAFSMLGPTAATLLGDVPMAAAGARKFAAGEDVGQGEKNAAERLLPFNSYYGLRQFLKYFVNPPDQ